MDIRAVIDEASNPVIVVSRQGNIDYANPAACREFGYTAPELEGQPVAVLIPARYSNHETYRREYMKAPGKRMTRPMGLGRDLYALRKDDTEFPVEIELIPTENRGVIAYIRRKE